MLLLVVLLFLLLWNGGKGRGTLDFVFLGAWGLGGLKGRKGQDWKIKDPAMRARVTHLPPPRAPPWRVSTYTLALARHSTTRQTQHTRVHLASFLTLSKHLTTFRTRCRQTPQTHLFNPSEKGRQCPLYGPGTHGTRGGQVEFDEGLKTLWCHYDATMMSLCFHYNATLMPLWCNCNVTVMSL